MHVPVRVAVARSSRAVGDDLFGRVRTPPASSSSSSLSKALSGFRTRCGTWIRWQSASRNALDRHLAPRLPSEYWASNCYLGASFPAPFELALRDQIGLDRLMWGSDYPHGEGTWPHRGKHSASHSATSRRRRSRCCCRTTRSRCSISTAAARPDRATHRPDTRRGHDAARRHPGAARPLLPVSRGSSA